MQPSASLPLDNWPALLARLPPDLDLDEVARATKAVRRRRGDGIGDGETLLRLSLVHGPCGKSLQETAAWAYASGVAEVCAQSLNERLHRAAAFLAALTDRLIAARQPGPALVWPGRYLRLVDGSSLSQPGSRGTDWRIHAVYDLGRGGFSHLSLTDKHGAESLLRAPPVPGEVAIADRLYARARELAACLDPSSGMARDFIIRAGWNALALCRPDGQRFNLIAALERMAAATAPQEWRVQALTGPAATPTRVPLRLIAMPLPTEKADANRQRLKHRASRRQQTLDPRSLVAAGFVILVTSLPDSIPAAEIAAAYRLRWQIELGFKRLKSLLHIDRLPTRTEAGCRSWLHAHLILALLSDDMCQDILAAFP